jgi:hypothetical protein
MFLIDKEQPGKSVWRTGDFRHNVMTKQQAASGMEMAATNQRNLLEWNSPISMESK